MRQLHITRSLMAVAVVAMVAAPALAGPPLVCVPYDIGTAASLPWDADGRTWKGMRADYPVSQLTRDTLALLTPATPVIVRMETLRRAALYATQNPEVARTLLTALLGRAKAADANPLAVLDAGYLVETYKQTSWLSRETAALAAGIDGYALAGRTLAVRTPATEFAAAMMTADGRRGAWAEHVRGARAGARADQLLARNIAQLER